MDQKNRTLIVVLIAVVIMIAMFASFSLYVLPGSTPQVVLPTSSGSETTDPAPGPVSPDSSQFLAVEVTTDTVQSIVATLDRADSYAREITVTDFWGESGSASTGFSVWVDNGLTRVQARLNSGRVQNTLLTGQSLYLWYEQNENYLTFAADDHSPDLLQRFPTYEDILSLDPASITDAGYTVREGWTCIYVEVADRELDYLSRYWVDIGSGLLVMAETESDGRIVYQMTSAALQSPCPPNVSFLLPDGSQPDQPAGQAD